MVSIIAGESVLCNTNPVQVWLWLSSHHMAQVLIHLANVLLVMAVVLRVSNKWGVAFLGALLYGTFPVASQAVFWISEQSPVATCLSLVAVFFWAKYLQGKQHQDYLIAIGALILALLSRESAIVVPIVFFLIDCMIIGERAKFSELLRRYLAVALVTVGYLGIEYGIQLNGLNVEVGGYSLGWHIVSNYVDYFSMLVSPWGERKPPVEAVIATLGFLTFAGVAVLKRSNGAIFLVLLVFLTIAPFVFLRIGVNARYLYMTEIPWVIVWAYSFEMLRVRWQSVWLRTAISTVLACFVVLNAAKNADLATAFSETARRGRVPFADIIRQHPIFPPTTRLFLIEPPFDTPIPAVEGMFFLRYGSTVSVGGTYEDGHAYNYGRLRTEKANFHDYSTAYVYYFDETNRPIEVAVDKEAKAHIVPGCPCDFNVPIRLEGYEITSSEIRRNQPLVLILYWRAIGQIDRDYTVFVHLVDFSGRIVTGVDGYPRNGNERTSAWHPDQLTADAHVITVPQDTVSGSDYHLEVGLYYLPTMQRLSIVDGRGEPMSDKVVIGPFKISQ